MKTTTDPTFQNAWNDIAEHYADDVGVYPGQVKILERLIESTDTILDVGCGAGHHLQLLAGLGAQIIGVDASTEMLKIAAQRTAEAKNVYLARQNAVNLAIANNSVDVSLCLNNTLGVIAGHENRQMVIAEIIRTAKRIAVFELLIANEYSEKAVSYFINQNGDKVSYQAARFDQTAIEQMFAAFNISIEEVRPSALEKCFVAVVVQK